MKRNETKRVRMARTAHYKEMRIESMEAKLMFNVLSLSKWDFLRSKRAQYEDMAIERIRARKQMTLLIVHVYKDLLIREIWKKYSEKLAEHYWKQKEKVATIIIQLATLGWGRRYGASLEVRD